MLPEICRDSVLDAPVVAVQMMELVATLVEAVLVRRDTTALRQQISLVTVDHLPELRGACAGTGIPLLSAPSGSIPRWQQHPGG